MLKYPQQSPSKVSPKEEESMEGEVPYEIEESDVVGEKMEAAKPLEAYTIEELKAAIAAKEDAAKEENSGV